MNKYYPEASVYYGFSDDMSYSPTVLGHLTRNIDSQNINSTMYDTTYNHFTTKYKSMMARGPEYNPNVEHYGTDSSDNYLQDYKERKHGSSVCNKLTGIQDCIESSRLKYAQKNASSADRAGITKLDSDTSATIQSKYTSRYTDLRSNLYNERLPSLQPVRFTESSITQGTTDSYTINKDYVKPWRQPDRKAVRTNTMMRFTQQLMD